MHDFDKISVFISLRASGFTYKEIQEEIGVTKPTLVKWNKKYEDEIESTSKFAFCKLFGQELIEDKNQIMLYTDILIKSNNEEYDELLDQKYVNKALDYLEKKFKNEIKSIGFTLTKYGKIKVVTYNFINEE
ncbi:MAG: helix-turn-helix domain-containing protein [Ignavibacteriae bacterium]|nr:helix-turn-helix domain-containing protein [Ignavibacteriota bacterium]